MAEEAGWAILDFRRPVSLADRLNRPVPIISGATVTAAVGAGIAWVLMRKKKAERQGPLRAFLGK